MLHRSLWALRGRRLHSFLRGADAAEQPRGSRGACCSGGTRLRTAGHSLHDAQSQSDTFPGSIHWGAFPLLAAEID